MKVGLSFPNFGEYAEPSAIVELATVAEKGGWDGFFVWDHIVIADGMPVADPWVLLGAAAQATESVRLGPMVVAMPRHRPWMVSRQAVTVDRLSNGRMTLGVGIGFPPDEEFATFGEPTDPRVRADMLDEGLEIVTAMWRGDTVEYSGRHYEVNGKSFRPGPVQQPRIPIWVAGSLPHLRPFQRAARFDGVFPIRADMKDMNVDDLVDVLQYVSRFRTADGPFDVVVGGPPHSNLAELEDAGATWFITGPDPRGESLDETLSWVAHGPPGDGGKGT